LAKQKIEQEKVEEQIVQGINLAISEE